MILDIFSRYSPYNKYPFSFLSYFLLLIKKLYMTIKVKNLVKFRLNLKCIQGVL